jgi:hypothetical protein
MHETRRVVRRCGKLEDIRERGLDGGKPTKRLEEFCFRITFLVVRRGC